MTSDERSPDAPGLYLHVPFCVSRCRYCAFPSGTHLEDMDRWAEGILREALLRREGWGFFGTFYLGGGTPSVLPLDLLDRLVERLGQVLPLNRVEEWTLEVNPQDVTPAHVEAWMAMGFRRISLGIQALRDEHLAFLGRRHDAAQARRAVGIVREAGCENLGLDLLFGIPGQGPRDWETTLEEALQWHPEHLSLYALTPEGRTPLVRAIASGTTRMPTDATVTRLYHLAVKRLRDAGYLHYEVSNWAVDPGHRSRHNRRYWRRVPVLGLGPAAHSFDGTRRWRNVRSLPDWTARIGQNRIPSAELEILTAESVRLEILMMGLRSREGVPRHLAEESPSGPSRVRALLSRGFLRQSGDLLVPTDRGMWYGDGMARRLA